jgi:hypothetical protein
MNGAKKFERLVPCKIVENVECDNSFIAEFYMEYISPDGKKNTYDLQMLWLIPTKVETIDVNIDIGIISMLDEYDEIRNKYFKLERILSRSKKAKFLRDQDGTNRLREAIKNEAKKLVEDLKKIEVEGKKYFTGLLGIDQPN